MIKQLDLYIFNDYFHLVLNLLLDVIQLSLIINIYLIKFQVIFLFMLISSNFHLQQYFNVTIQYLNDVLNELMVIIKFNLILYDFQFKQLVIFMY